MYVTIGTKFAAMENHRTDSIPNDSYPVKSARLLAGRCRPSSRVTVGLHVNRHLHPAIQGVQIRSGQRSRLVPAWWFLSLLERDRLTDLESLGDCRRPHAVGLHRLDLGGVNGHFAAPVHAAYLY